MDNEYLDFDEAVLFLKTTPSTLYKWLQAGKIPGHKLGRQWRFLREELEIHISGQGPKIHKQKDLLALWTLLQSREGSQKKQKELSMNSPVQLSTNHLSEKLIWDAFDHGTREIHMYPTKGQYEISYRTRGGIEKLSMIQEETFVEMNESFTKISSASQDGLSRRLYLHRGEEDVLQVKYQKIETITGPRITLRLWQPEKDVLPLKKLSSDPKVIGKYVSWLKTQSGIFIVTGEAGSGKTTTVYSLLNEFKNQGRVVFTIEESAELIIDGVHQVEMKGLPQYHFENIYAQVRASDPDVICILVNSVIGIEELIYKTAQTAAMSGKLILLQLNFKNCAEALESFSKFAGDASKALIRGVSAQSLVREESGLKARYEFKD